LDTSVTPSAMAWAAFRKSLLPIGVLLCSKAAREVRGLTFTFFYFDLALL
jgi:hypothetical protein